MCNKLPLNVFSATNEIYHFETGPMTTISLAIYGHIKLYHSH